MVKKEVTKNTDKIFMGRRSFRHFSYMVFILLFASITPVAADPPPLNQGCQAIAYTESGDHYFLIASNKTVFGSNVTIQLNCESIEVYFNGNFAAYTENPQISIPINMTTQSISIYSNNYSFEISNITVLPDRLTWQFEYYDWQYGERMTLEEYISLTAAQTKANWASILSIIIVFSLVTLVYWNLINSYIDRNYCEEVKE